MKQLGGMQPCAAGAEAHVTHLVMGSPRRTLKVRYPQPKLLLYRHVRQTLLCGSDMLQRLKDQGDAGY